MGYLIFGKGELEKEENEIRGVVVSHMPLPWAHGKASAITIARPIISTRSGSDGSFMVFSEQGGRIANTFTVIDTPTGPVLEGKSVATSGKGKDRSTLTYAWQAVPKQRTAAK